MNPLRAKYASDVLHALITSQKDRIQTGLQKREEILAAIERGEQPTGYRVDFLRDSAKRLIMELGRIAKDFNEAHPQDRCSAQDFLDILSTTTAWLKKKTGKDQE